MSKKPTQAQMHHFAFEQGRTAARAGIDRQDAPHTEDEALDAWHAGYDFERPHKPEVEAADVKALSQIDTAAKGGKAS